jgi:hypothetical protein
MFRNARNNFSRLQNKGTIDSRMHCLQGRGGARIAGAMKARAPWKGMPCCLMLMASIPLFSTCGTVERLARICRLCKGLSLPRMSQNDFKFKRSVLSAMPDDSLSIPEIFGPSMLPIYMHHAYNHTIEVCEIEN